MYAFGYLALFALYAAGFTLYLFALIWVYRDADETYGTGPFWLICMAVVPLITFPVYLLMRMGTHRSVDEDLAAWKRREHEKRLGYHHSGTVMDLSEDLKDEVRWSSGNDGYTIGTSHPGPDFKPFQSSFSESAERLRRLHQQGERTHRPRPRDDP